MTSALTFQNTHFDVVEKRNQIWLSASDIAKALGYAHLNSISRVYARNKDEFSNEMTEEVNLTLSGNLTKSVRVFSLRGAHLIAMFARTAIAKQFRKWVLDILDKHTQLAAPIIEPKSRNQIQTALWPTHFRSGWNRATFSLFGVNAQYITFNIEPTSDRYCGTFCFADHHQRELYVAKQLGDLGYFESSDIEELWRQVVRFCGRCNSRCAFF
jgi:hypothetical protein